jgi:hypothetical protein
VLLPVDGFSLNLLSKYFWNICREISSLLKYGKGGGGWLHLDQYTFLIISLSVLLRMRYVSDKRCREDQSTHFTFSNSFLENLSVYEIMWKIM